MLSGLGSTQPANGVLTVARQGSLTSSQQQTITHKWSLFGRKWPGTSGYKDHTDGYEDQLRKGFCFCKFKSVGRLNGMPCLGPEVWWFEKDGPHRPNCLAENAEEEIPSRSKHLSWRHLSLKTNIISSNSTHSEHPGHLEWSERNYKRQHRSSVDRRGKKKNFFFNSIETWVWM